MKGRRPGFTIVELMIVVGIIGVLVALIIPTYAKVRNDAWTRLCKANLMQIEAAIEHWAFDNGIADGTPLVSYKDEIYGYLQSGEPACPSGVRYVLKNCGDIPQVICSSNLEGHEYP